MKLLPSYSLFALSAALSMRILTCSAQDSHPAPSNPPAVQSPSPLNPFMHMAPTPQVSNEQLNDLLCIRIDGSNPKDHEQGWLYIGPDDTMVFSTESCTDAILKDNTIHPRVPMNRARI